MKYMASSRPAKRRTRQRETILNAFLSAHGPMTVEEVHELGRQDLDNLGLATVYRAVKCFLEDGLLDPVHLPDGPTRYEISGKEHHFHFLCSRCIRAFCIPRCPVDGMGARDLPIGFEARDHDLTVYGLCPDCQAAAS